MLTFSGTAAATPFFTHVVQEMIFASIGNLLNLLNVNIAQNKTFTKLSHRLIEVKSSNHMCLSLSSDANTDHLQKYCKRRSLNRARKSN